MFNPYGTDQYVPPEISLFDMIPDKEHPSPKSGAYCETCSLAPNHRIFPNLDNEICKADHIPNEKKKKKIDTFIHDVAKYNDIAKYNDVAKRDDIKRNNVLINITLEWVIVFVLIVVIIYLASIPFILCRIMDMRMHMVNFSSSLDLK
ncbi:MAG: hypothetical protein KAS12_01480 [Candidatus Aenigmarchaeota archaeon]|nr:hypothetical protein [Candidatus Aenigmarchaeota archaeon]